VAPLACKSTPAPLEVDARAPAEAPAAQAGTATASVDLVDGLARCEVDHGGVLIDLGSAAAHGVSGTWTLAPDPALAESEREGESWARVVARRFDVRFVLEEPTPVFVGMRARGGSSRSVAVTVDGKPLGLLPLIRGQARVVGTRATATPFAAGAHTLDLRFAAAPRAQSEPLAEIDWVRVGTWDEESSTYVPPTMRQIVTNASLGGVPHRSVAVRAPSVVRCSTFVSPGARLKLAMGFEGQGEGDGDVRIARDGEPPVELRAEHVKGSDHAEWAPVDVPLEGFAGRVATLELRSKSSSSGGRVLFGDPALYLASQDAKSPAARLAVVVMMSGIDPSKVVSRQAYPAIAELDSAATIFEAHRSPTTVAAGVVASLLTGLSPRAHGVEDAGARLPAVITTLGVAARDGSVQTAMFSGCPSTFEAFGFSRGWDKYQTYSPVEGAPAVAPLTEATRWTVEHMKSADARALVVVHARGGHPPWDVTINESAKLPPSEYSGPMEARRAGELLARARARRSRFHLSENDRTRMWAIYDAALAGQDRALGQFVDALKKASLWDQTLFVVAGDVSIAGDSRAPFGDGEEPSEQLLRVPLWVHFPGNALSGKRVASPTTVTDIARSVLGALRLATPEEFEGVDLFALASGAAMPAGRPLVATLGQRYSLRLGDLVLSGTSGRAPTLCDTSSDPNCETDRMDKMPRASALLFRLAFEAEMAAQKHKHPREPATVDPGTAAAIQVWGE
jgi:hypothetical protein